MRVSLAVPPLPTQFVPKLEDGRPAFPKWKTQWEREAERQKHTSGGLVSIDQFDDYRQLHAQKFFITQPPTGAVRTPAEYEPSQGYLLQWTSGLGAARDKIYTDMIKGAWGVVPLTLAYVNASHKAAMQSKLLAAGLDPNDVSKVTFWPHKLNSIWVRDSGPIAIANKPAVGVSKIAFVDPHYYHARIYDDELPTDLAKAWGVNVFRPDINLEGGNLMSTGDGLCAASAGVLAFNAQLSQSAIEEVFAEYLGCNKTLFPQWLKGEGTTHIDMFAKFASDTAVLVGSYSSAQDATNKQILDDAAQLFGQTTTPNGQPLKVVRIPMPNNRSGTQRIWRTYTNSLSLAGGSKKVVLIPTYAKETSKEAAATAAYAQVFPGWTLVKIPTDAIIGWGGSIHCITMQIPAGQLSKMQADPKDKCGVGEVSCDSCAGIGGSGCCDGQVLKYCNNQSKLVVFDCSADPQCGWNAAKNWYDCGTNGGSDPGGDPLACANGPDAAVLADAGVSDGSAGDAGAKPCGTVAYQGCCAGEMLRFCDNGTLKTMDCTGAPQCGWNSQGFYDCGSGGGADPSGQYARACPADSDAAILVPDGGVADAGASVDAVPDVSRLPDSAPLDTSALSDGASSARDVGPAADGPAFLLDGSAGRPDGPAKSTPDSSGEGATEDGGCRVSARATPECAGWWLLLLFVGLGRRVRRCSR